MKICQPHWDKLRNKIGEMGMTHLVANSGEDLKERIRTGGFCPLASASALIYQNAIQCGGPYLLEGDLCPLCELDVHGKSLNQNSDDWIGLASEGVLTLAKDQKLITVN